MYSVIPGNSANPVSLCRLLGCRPKEKHIVNQMIVQNWLPTLPSITVFNAKRTNLSLINKGCREGGHINVNL
jgi:hypothetical protein